MKTAAWNWTKVVAFVPGMWLLIVFTSPLLAELGLRCNKFLTGMLVWTLFTVLTFAGIEAYKTWFNRENEPMKVRLENAHKALRDLLNDWPEGVR